MSFDVSKGAAYAVLYSLLVVFTILALGAAGWLSFLPFSVASCWAFHRPDGQEETNWLTSTDNFLSARNAAGTWSIALSFFASGMGAWVLYGTTEVGATPQLSWIAVFGYSGGSALPAIVIGWLIGPRVREMTSDAFSTTDFGRQRYGRVMQVIIACISGFYMFIYLVAELTAISGIFALLTNDDSTRFLVGISLSVGAFTMFYTTIAGLPGSLVTDKFQGIVMAILVIMLTLAVSLNPENKISRSEFDLASNWTTEGLTAAVTLIIAILSAELFNQGTWQRVWAAESVTAMRRGFLIGSVMVFFLMTFFGVMGMIAYANDPESYDSGAKYSYLAFFDLLAPLSEGWQILTLILVVALCASSVDTLQIGLSSIFSHDLVKIGWNPKWITRALIVAINAPAIYLASKSFKVLELFLVADLVCATSVFPVFCGLQTKDKGILKAPTELGAFVGCLSGIATVLVIGVVTNADGGVFEYFWLQNDGICALCGNETMVTFIITPMVSLAMTYIASFLDVALRGEKARGPLIPIPFDKDDEADDGEKKESPIDDEGELEFDGGFEEETPSAAEDSTPTPNEADEKPTSVEMIA